VVRKGATSKLARRASISRLYLDSGLFRTAFAAETAICFPPTDWALTSRLSRERSSSKESQDGDRRKHRETGQTETRNVIVNP
jgi:hypothetical protein